MEGPYFVATQRGLTGGIMETGFPYICFDVILPKQSIHYSVSTCGCDLRPSACGGMTNWGILSPLDEEIIKYQESNIKKIRNPNIEILNKF